MADPTNATDSTGAPVPPLTVVQRLATENFVWLCTLRPDGSPHLTPVWFLFEEGTWCISTATANRKVAHVAADPRVSLALPDGDDPVVAEGSATVHHGAPPNGVAGRFAAKYDGWDITSPRPDGPRSLLEVRTHRWLLRGSQLS